MQLTLLPGYPDRVGRRAIFVGSGKGPANYTGGTAPTDVLTGPFEFYIDAVISGISLSGTYVVVAQPTSVGPRATWHLRYYTFPNGAEVPNGSTFLANETFVVSGFGGFS